MDNVFFKKSRPVWIAGLETEMNITCGFYTSIEKRESHKYQLNLTASSFYRLFINGKFICLGPSRCGHGWFRVDELDLTDILGEGINHIAIEATGYNINSFEYLDQPSFLIAEIFENGESAAATSAGEDNAFTCLRLTNRYRKMQRMSFQRPMTESYRLTPGVDDWRVGELDGFAKQRAQIAECAEVHYTSRGSHMNSFVIAEPERIIVRGNVRKIHPERYFDDRAYSGISEKCKGFKKDELEVRLSDDICELEYYNAEQMDKAYDGATVLKSGEYETYALDVERTGLIGFHITADADSVLYFTADEILSGGDVDPLRLGMINIIRLDIKAGEYDFLSAAAYGFKYMKLTCTEGSVKIDGIALREVRYPEEIRTHYTGDNEKLAGVYNAAIESFCQNSSDLFMDCPTRERAGWLCDGFFTGRVEHMLTGSCTIEKCFLENFILTEGFKCLPDGMLPMCYPSDHYDGTFIPNWAMWFVMQLGDHVKRTGDAAFAEPFRKTVYGLIRYFEQFENEFGLLEGLKSWVFVEWSKANELVQDVNYPTNMLYSGMLREAAALYGDNALIEKARHIEDTIRERSFDGEFFVDNERRENGVLVSTGERTETCQYYAFFFGIANPYNYPKLWNVMLDDFGPDRAKLGLYPEIYPSNAFIGNYLRLDILTSYGFREKCLSEIEKYFCYMADKTGTLWENIGDYASCNHGFASYAAYLINKNTK